MLNYRPLIVAGLMFGIGQGGFFDGIVFHQLLQWHHMGAGLFNLVEGIIDHHILGIHHLKPGAHQLLWDLGFLASGFLLLAIGLLLLQAAKVEKSNLT